MSALTVFKVAKHGGNPVLRAIGFLSQICGFLSAGMILAAVFITTQMIFVRFVLNQSTIWQTEAVVYLVVGATLIGLPYVQKLRGHVNVDLLPLMLPKKLRKVLAVITLLAAIGIIAVMLFYGFEMWYTAWARNWRSDTIWGVRLWIPYLAVPVGFFLYLLQLAADLLATLLDIEAPFGIDEGEAL